LRYVVWGRALNYGVAVAVAAPTRENVRVIVERSASGYPETVGRLSAAIERRGLTVFARIDHAAAARESGMQLADEEVIVFGNPRAGTPLMQSDPRIGIELPLRILVWADAEGVSIGYRDPRELAADYDAAQHESTLEQMATLLAALSAEAATTSGEGGA
jgi:uncharacterized protein (DUF302 family)